MLLFECGIKIMLFIGSALVYVHCSFIQHIKASGLVKSIELTASTYLGDICESARILQLINVTVIIYARLLIGWSDNVIKDRKFVLVLFKFFS